MDLWCKPSFNKQEKIPADTIESDATNLTKNAQNLRQEPRISTSTNLEPATKIVNFQTSRKYHDFFATKTKIKDGEIEALLCIFSLISRRTKIRVRNYRITPFLKPLFFPSCLIVSFSFVCDWFFSVEKINKRALLLPFLFHYQKMADCSVLRSASKN